MDSILGEIRIFAGNYAPQDWALCNGQLLKVADNQALFALLGNTYGGDGVTNFALPDLRGRVPLHQGPGPGLTSRPLGSSGGSETVILSTQNLPAHNHNVMAANTAPTQTGPGNAVLAPVVPTSGSAVINAYTPPTGATIVDLSSAALNPAGQAGVTVPHNNMMPFVGLTYIIALVGAYPTPQS